LLVLILLLPIAALGLAFAIGLFTLGAWHKALVCAREAKFIAAGLWLCAGIFLIDVLNVAFNGEAWQDFGPLYVAIMIGSVGATVLKFAPRRHSFHFMANPLEVCRRS
jgi:hypothetical protein